MRPAAGKACLDVARIVDRDAGGAIRAASVSVFAAGGTRNVGVYAIQAIDGCEHCHPQ